LKPGYVSDPCSNREWLRLRVLQLHSIAYFFLCLAQPSADCHTSRKPFPIRLWEPRPLQKPGYNCHGREKRKPLHTSLPVLLPFSPSVFYAMH